MVCGGGGAGGIAESGGAGFNFGMVAWLPIGADAKAVAIAAAQRQLQLQRCCGNSSSGGGGGGIRSGGGAARTVVKNMKITVTPMFFLDLHLFQC